MNTPCTCGLGDRERDKHHESNCPRWMRYADELDREYRTICHTEAGACPVVDFRQFRIFAVIPPLDAATQTTDSRDYSNAQPR